MPARSVEWRGLAQWVGGSVPARSVERRGLAWLAGRHRPARGGFGTARRGHGCGRVNVPPRRTRRPTPRAGEESSTAPASAPTIGRLSTGWSRLTRGMRRVLRGELTMFHSARHMPTRLRAASILHDLGPLLAGTSGHRSRCNKQRPLRFPLQRASPCGAWRCEHEPIKELDDLWKTLPHSCEFAPPNGGPEPLVARLRRNAKSGR